MPWITVLALAVPLTGCFWVTTKHEGKTLRKDVDALEKKVEEDLDESVERLKKTLDEASKLLARNSADLGAEVSEVQQEYSRITGLVMEAKRYTDEIKSQLDRQEQLINDLEARILALEGAGQPTIPPDELYKQASVALEAKDYKKAQDLYRALVVQHPDHSRADDAQYYRAEAFFRDGDFKTAVPEFQAVFEKYASSALADDALFRAGESSEKIKKCTDARAYFGLLRQKYPSSSLASKAKQKDEYLKKNSKNKKVCGG